MAVRKLSRRPSAHRMCIGFLIITGFLGGCSSVVDSSRRTAEAARVVVTGTSEVPLTLVTSTRFTVLHNDEGDEMIALIQSDTAVLPLPIDRSVQFGQSDRFFVQLLQPDPNVTATVDMRVSVDGQEVYRQPAGLRQASIAFSYFLQ